MGGSATCLPRMPTLASCCTCACGGWGAAGLFGALLLTPSSETLAHRMPDLLLLICNPCSIMLHMADGQPFPYLDLACTLLLAAGAAYGMEM